MKKGKLALVYGLIAGGIMISMWFVGALLAGDDLDKGDYANSELIGYITMILAFTTIVVAVKKRRDRAEGASFSFKEGFLTGLYIVLVASAVYVIGWMVYYPNFMPDFADQYLTQQVANIEANEVLSAEQKTEQIAKQREFMELYKQPPVMAAFTFLEVFPVGFFIALITALVFWRRKG